MKKVAFLALILVSSLTLSTLNMVGRLGRTVQAGSPSYWSQYYGQAGCDWKAYSVVQTSDGGYLLAGTNYSYPISPPPTGNGYHALLVKTDSSGNTQWIRSYLSPVSIPSFADDEVRCVVQTGDGGYAFAGYTQAPNSSVYAWLVKTDSAGNQVWSKTYGGSLDKAYSMVQTSDGGYALAGTQLWKTDSTGTLQWSKPIGVAYSIVQTSDGGYALAGAYIWKTDSSGTVQWSTPLPQLTSTFWALDAYSIIPTSDGGYAYAGDAGLPISPGSYLAKTDSLGKVQWNTTGNAYAFYSVVQTSDGGYAVAGSTSSYGHGMSDVDLLKTDSGGGHEWEEYYGSAKNDGGYCVIETSDGGLAIAGYYYISFMYLIKLSAFVPPPTYWATIWSWDELDSHGWISVPITMDGVPTGHSTGYNFTGLTGTHTFTVPSTDPDGRPFSDWSTGWTDKTITVSLGGIYTARYRAGYSVTIQSWCDSEPNKWISVPITKDGVSTGSNTPQTFTGLTGTHTFTVPSTDASDHTFYEWNTGWPDETLTVSSAGVYTARYRQATAVLVVRGLDNRIYYRILGGGSWNSWNVVPSGATCDSPAAALLGNYLIMVVRGMDGNSLWGGSIDLASNIFSGWAPLSGATHSAPTLTSNGTALCLVVRGLDNRIYLCCYTGGSWGSWHALSKGATSDGPAAALVGDNLNLIVRGMDGNSLWYVQVTCDGTFITDWTLNPGATDKKPAVGKVPTTLGTVLGLTVKGLDSKIYVQAGAPWQPWTSGATIDGPAATGSVDNKLHVVVRGMDGNTLWYGYYDTYYSSFSGWTPLSGSTPSAPTLAS